MQSSRKTTRSVPTSNWYCRRVEREWKIDTLKGVRRTRSYDLAASMENTCGYGRKRRPWGQFSACFPPHSILQGNFELQYRTTSAPPHSPAPPLSRTVLRLNLILPIPYCKADQKSVANS